MLTQTENVNVAYDDHFIIVFGKDGVINDV